MSAYDVVNALCRLWKFERYLLVLGLGSLEIPPVREELRGPTNRTPIAILVLSAVIDRTRTQTGRWVFRSNDQVLILVYLQSYSAQAIEASECGCLLLRLTAFKDRSLSVLNGSFRHLVSDIRDLRSG